MRSLHHTGLATTLCRELIKRVRQCKTQQEERDVISKESAALRQAFKEQDSTYRHRCVQAAGGGAELRLGTGRGSQYILWLERLCLRPGVFPLPAGTWPS